VVGPAEAGWEYRLNPEAWVDKCDPREK
jgi:hypothetical protein